TRAAFAAREAIERLHLDPHVRRLSAEETQLASDGEAVQPAAMDHDRSVTTAARDRHDRRMADVLRSGVDERLLSRAIVAGENRVLRPGHCAEARTGAEERVDRRLARRRIPHRVNPRPRKRAAALPLL